MPGILRELTGAQLKAFVASLLGWALDAFDFFIFVFCLKAISAEFHTDIKAVAEGIFLTLAFRPLGALVFGWLAEKYGRRPILMVNVAQLRGGAAGHGLRPQPGDAARAARGVRLRHGRRVGSGRGAGARDPAGQGTRFLLRPAAGRLRDRLPAGVDRLRLRLRARRLARHVHYRRQPRAAGAVHPLWRRGIPRMAGGHGNAARFGGSGVACGEDSPADAFVPGAAHGLLQRLLARLAGPVSDVPAEPARPVRPRRPAISRSS